MTSSRHITIAHGAGGEVMQELIKGTILRYLSNQKQAKKIVVPLEALDDSAVIDDIVFTIDSHTIKPLFFPGGDIGSLAVSGTINDIAVMGAEPIALASAFVIEEGLLFDELEKILESMCKTCVQADVPIITGDTKVMGSGAIDKLTITTSAIGRRTEILEGNLSEVRKYRELNERWVRDCNLKDVDRIIVSGTIGDHGISLISFREGYGFESEVQSDITPLNKMIEEALKVGGIVSMKDPTRGGLANALNELSEKSGVGILIEEEKVPIKEAVRSACEMLGMDALEIGNEGKVIMGVVKEKAEEVLKSLRKTKEGKDAEIIGVATKKIKGVVMETSVGGKRVVEAPAGDPVPRIC